MKESTVDEITKIKDQANATRKEIYRIMDWKGKPHTLSDGDVRIVLETAWGRNKCRSIGTGGATIPNEQQ